MGLKLPSAYELEFELETGCSVLREASIHGGPFCAFGKGEELDQLVDDVTL